MMSDFKPETGVYFPETVSRLTMQEIRRLQENNDAAIKTQFSERIDANITPMRGGELIPVLGYTSNYKSGFMSFVVKK